MSSLGPIEVEETEAAGLSSEAVDGAIENAAGAALQCQYSPRNAAVFVPDLNRQAARLNLQSVLICQKRYRIFSPFQRSGAAAAG